MSENKSILNEEDDHEDSPYKTVKSHTKKKENIKPRQEKKTFKKNGLMTKFLCFHVV